MFELPAIHRVYSRSTISIQHVYKRQHIHAAYRSAIRTRDQLRKAGCATECQPYLDAVQLVLHLSTLMSDNNRTITALRLQRHGSRTPKTPNP